ncbi:hypothetical protein GCE9029_01182 [Grimontia celer]|uniref:Uncharacterized protein n=1 Tax=Grimontia celer TaxID=1796497 RepID=A0A128EYB1_9GAMM|nr:hypothetical protein [Grimontia celer]CZF78986.1 hypothetical protein GCE9029_01182 [Grimontia celer]
MNERNNAFNPDEALTEEEALDIIRDYWHSKAEYYKDSHKDAGQRKTYSKHKHIQEEIPELEKVFAENLDELRNMGIIR